MNNKILYISTNNGSDTRINKEVKTLSSKANVIYVGIGKESEQSFVKKYCFEFYLIKGDGRSIKSRISQVILIFKILLKFKITSVHIINEPTFIPVYLLVLNKHIVLDLFDSIFLNLSKPKNEALFWKKILYAPVNKLIVTDENRRSLLPDYLKRSKKVVVLENFPLFQEYKKSKYKNNNLVLIYSGTLMEKRGTKILMKLLDYDPNLEIISVGWVVDDVTREFIKHPRVIYLGTLEQAEVLSLTREKCNYIFSLYEPIHTQNINASPNKIYDGIMTETPIIMNREVKIASFIEKRDIGIVLDNYYDINYTELLENLRLKKNTFKFTEKMKLDNSWNNIENKLLSAHNLITQS